MPLLCLPMTQVPLKNLAFAACLGIHHWLAFSIHAAGLTHFCVADAHGSNMLKELGAWDLGSRLDVAYQDLLVRLLLQLSFMCSVGDEIEALMAEPAACLAFASHYSWDEDSPQGRRFAAMCGECACLGAMLTEVSTTHLLHNMNKHIYDGHNLRIPDRQANLQARQASCLLSHCRTSAFPSLRIHHSKL